LQFGCAAHVGSTPRAGYDLARRYLHSIEMADEILAVSLNRTESCNCAEEKYSSKDAG